MEGKSCAAFKILLLLSNSNHSVYGLLIPCHYLKVKKKVFLSSSSTLFSPCVSAYFKTSQIFDHTVDRTVFSRHFDFKGKKTLQFQGTACLVFYKMSSFGNNLCFETLQSNYVQKKCAVVTGMLCLSEMQGITEIL